MHFTNAKIMNAMEFWCTGEPAKSYVIRSFTASLAVSEDADAVQRVFRGCVSRAQEMIRQSEFFEPRDWQASIDCFGEACQWLDADRILGNEQSANAFREMMQAVVNSLDAHEQRDLEVLLLGSVLDLTSLGEDLTEKGVSNSIIDARDLNSEAEREFIAAAIRKVRNAILVFEVPRLLQDEQIVRALAEAKQKGTTVAHVAMSTVPVETVIEVCNRRA